MGRSKHCQKCERTSSRRSFPFRIHKLTVQLNTTHSRKEEGFYVAPRPHRRILRRSSHFYFKVSICLCFQLIHGAHLSYDDALLLMLVFFSLRHPFLWGLPDEFAFHIYYFSVGMLGSVKEERIRFHLSVTNPIYEIMKRSEVPVMRKKFLELYIGRSLFSYPFDRLIL